MAITIDIFNAYNNAALTINGARVTGPLRGYKGLQFVQRGAIINEAGVCSFSLPMTLRNNAPIAARTVVRLNDDVRGLLGTYMVGEKSETPSEDGKYAQFSCLDLVSELTFDTVPGLSAFTNEATIETLRRLLLIPYNTPYTPLMVNGADYFQGIDFLADDVTVQAAFTKLLGDRYFGWRRGDGRVIEYGSFKRDTGIRLVQASKRPGAMNRPKIRPIPTGGLRAVIDPASIYNCVAITGAGSGPYQHSLQPLYNLSGETAVPGTNWFLSGPTPLPGNLWFAGYDSNYPIYRRISYNGRGSDGFEYFLVDWPSVNRYRSSFYPLNRQDVGSTENTSDDYVETAHALYIIGWATLKRAAQANRALSVTTLGRGSNVGIGGDLVTVEWDEYDDRGQIIADSTYNRAPFVVLDVTTSVDDETGVETDTWALSDIGRAVQDDVATQTGMLQSLEQIRNAVTIYPMEKDIHRDEPITPTSPVVIHINLTQRIQKVQVARFALQLQSIYSTVTGGSVDSHDHTYVIPALSIDATVPYTTETAYNPAAQGLHGHLDDITANRSASNFTDGITAGRSGSYTEDISPNRTPGYGVSKSGNVTKGGSATGSGSVSDGQVASATTAFNTHYHTILVRNSGDPGFGAAGTGGNAGVVILRSDRRLYAVNQQQQVDSDPGIGYNSQNNFNHGHGSNFGVNDGISVNDGSGVSDGLRVGRGGGLNDGLGVSRGGPLTDNLGVSRGGNIYGYGGIQPDTRFPGYANLITRIQDGRTSGTKAPGFTPIYGKFSAPANQKPTNVRFWIGGVVVAGPFNTDQAAIDLRPYLQLKQPVDIVVTSDTTGRVIIDGEIEASKTIYGMA